MTPKQVSENFWNNVIKYVEKVAPNLLKTEPNYRLTTDSDVEITSNSDAQNTVFSINVSLHPKDIESLLNVFSDFLLNNCQKTNEEHERNKSDYEIIKLAIGE